tara:strand:- start:641 stop:1246 length:606 start_codon:yes stop_codon:yes gene_type:complete
MRIQDLANIDGANKLRLALGLDEDQVSKIQTLVSSMAGANPHIKETYVGKAAPGVSFYDFKNNKLGIGHKSSDVLAHEMGHAASLADASDFYKGLLRASKRATRISNALAVPIAGFLGLNPKMTKEQKEKALNVATAISSGLAAPNLFEELKASGRAIYHSPTKLRTGAAMVPGMMSHSLNDLAAPVTYYLANKLLGENSK